MTDSNKEVQDLNLDFEGAKIEVRQGVAHCKQQAACIDITINGKQLRLEARPVSEDFDGDLVVSTVKVAVTESNTEMVAEKVHEFMDDPKMRLILIADGVRKI